MDVVRAITTYFQVIRTSCMHFIRRILLHLAACEPLHFCPKYVPRVWPTSKICTHCNPSLRKYGYLYPHWHFLRECRPCCHGSPPWVLSLWPQGRAAPGQLTDSRPAMHSLLWCTERARFSWKQNSLLVCWDHFSRVLQSPWSLSDSY